VSDYDRRAGWHRGEPSRRRHAEACSSEEMKQQLDLEKLECNMDLGGADIPPPVLDLMEGGGGTSLETCLRMQGPLMQL
jgi:hypothetical protein